MSSWVSFFVVDKGNLFPLFLHLLLFLIILPLITLHPPTWKLGIKKEKSLPIDMGGKWDVERRGSGKNYARRKGKDHKKTKTKKYGK